MTTCVSFSYCLLDTPSMTQSGLRTHNKPSSSRCQMRCPRYITAPASAEIEQKLNNLTKEVSKIKDNLASLEILTYDTGKVNPHIFCIGDLDTKIINYLIDHRAATTTELAEVLETNRWLILNHLRKIAKASKKQLGKAIIEYYAGERAGKRKAWWIKEDLTET